MSGNNVAGFNKFTFPIIRAKFPALSIADLVAIEPINLRNLWKNYLYREKQVVK